MREFRQCTAHTSLTPQDHARRPSPRLRQSGFQWPHEHRLSWSFRPRVAAAWITILVRNLPPQPIIPSTAKTLGCLPTWMDSLTPPRHSASGFSRLTQSISGTFAPQIGGLGAVGTVACHLQVFVMSGNGEGVLRW